MASKLVHDLRSAIAQCDRNDDLELARLVRLRHTAFSEVEQPKLTPSTSDVPQVEPNDIAVVDRLELAVDGGSVDALRQHIARYGCALIPHAIPDDEIIDLRTGIDRAFEAFDAFADTPPSQWFHPFHPNTDSEQAGRVGDLDGRRRFNREAGSIWAADSPGMLARLLDIYERRGVIALLTDFFGEGPAISMNKCTLRRLEPDASTGDWHQDGAFMGGQDIRSLNVWMALSDCGAGAPGMDIVPTRLPLAETGTEGAWFDWSVSPVEVDRIRGPVPVLRPDFCAGDLLLFDHRFLHRTAEATVKARPRYAIETWFFPPTDYPSKQVPILV
jgi:Phytanoyl-CoA dioxygenase (PhyH)